MSRNLGESLVPYKLIYLNKQTFKHHWKHDTNAQVMITVNIQLNLSRWSYDVLKTQIHSYTLIDVDDWTFCS